MWKYIVSPRIGTLISNMWESSKNFWSWPLMGYIRKLENLKAYRVHTCGVFREIVLIKISTLIRLCLDKAVPKVENRKYYDRINKVYLYEYYLGIKYPTFKYIVIYFSFAPIKMCSFVIPSIIYVFCACVCVHMYLFLCVVKS